MYQVFHLSFLYNHISPMQARIINLPKIDDPRGNLSFIEEENHVPFKIKRTYWIYDVPGGQVRGGHAFIEQREFIVAISGSFDVMVDNGKTTQTFSLNRSYYGLYIPAGLWRQMQNFSTNSLAIILSSTRYHEDDYIRSYDEFLNFINKGEKQ
jgi:dTDP-4-dehydrorhamnose 3,5-epimerase-like enzyme